MIHSYFHLTSELAALRDLHPAIDRALETFGGPTTIGRIQYKRRGDLEMFWDLTWTYDIPSSGNFCYFECHAHRGGREVQLYSPSGAHSDVSTWLEDWRVLQQSCTMKKRAYCTVREMDIDLLREWAKERNT